MTIGISIDGVLRDFAGKFRSLYEKAYETEINEPILTADWMKYLPFESEDELNHFLYEEYSLELFGHANEPYRTAVIDLNKLYDLYKDNHEIILLSKEHGNSISATLFFLSKTSCKIRNYNFVKSEIEALNYCDIIITSHPDILNNIPENKIGIKIKTEYNQNINCPYTFDKLKDLLGNSVFDNLLNSKIISHINL